MAMELYVPARGGPGTSHGIVKDIHEDIKHEYADSGWSGDDTGYSR